MLSVDFDRCPIGPGERVLDIGCGGGRHAFEAYRRGARVVAVDISTGELADVARMLRAMAAAGEAPGGAEASVVRGDVLSLPFADDSFDRVIAAEILEHIPHDIAAIGELFRVLRPGGTAAVTVPRWLPERICWALSEPYHRVDGGHVRIYTRAELEAKCSRAGFTIGPHHYAHGLHSPYWWLKCAVGVDNTDHPLPRAYHKLLVWDIVKRPWLTRVAERALDPVIGKSVVVYLRKPIRAAAPRPAHVG